MNLLFDCYLLFDSSFLLNTKIYLRQINEVMLSLV